MIRKGPLISFNSRDDRWVYYAKADVDQEDPYVYWTNAMDNTAVSFKLVLTCAIKHQGYPIVIRTKVGYVRDDDECFVINDETDAVAAILTHS